MNTPYPAARAVALTARAPHQRRRSSTRSQCQRIKRRATGTQAAHRLRRAETYSARRSPPRPAATWPASKTLPAALAQAAQAEEVEFRVERPRLSSIKPTSAGAVVSTDTLSDAPRCGPSPRCLDGCRGLRQRFTAAISSRTFRVSRRPRRCSAPALPARRCNDTLAPTLFWISEALARTPSRRASA
jgi:hypothetical protein